MKEQVFLRVVMTPPQLCIFMQESHPPCISDHHNETNHWHNEGSREADDIGQETHEHGSYGTTYRREHQDAGSSLSEGTQSTEGEGEHGWEHDGLEGIVGNQRIERQLTHIQEDQSTANHRSNGADKQYQLGTYTTHHSTAHEPHAHEKQETKGKQTGSYGWIDASHAFRIVDK